MTEVTFTIDCEFCGGKSIKQTKQPETKFMRVTGQASQAYTCCIPCAKKIDEHNRPFEEAQEEKERKKREEREAAKAANQRNEVAAKTESDPVIVALAGALTKLAEGQDKIIELLSKDGEKSTQ
jgi:hypothetical protein